MKTNQAMAACVALAIGAHAALLMQRSPGTGNTALPASAAVSVRLQAADVPVDDTPPQAYEELSTPPADAAPAATQPASTSPTAAEEPAPAFDGGVPAIGFPDAQLPAGGTEVRAYLVLDSQGLTQSVTTAAAPQLPVGFQKVAEAGLRQARLQPGHAAAYCLLVRFDADAPEPKLAWLPGAARDAGRCLAGALPAPREIASEPAP